MLNFVFYEIHTPHIQLLSKVLPSRNLSAAMPNSEAHKAALFLHNRYWGFS